jgi:hypothetical protein
MAQFLTPPPSFSYYNSSGESMKTDSCSEITDAKRIEMKTGLSEPGEDRNAGFILPAFILMGLGVGLLTDHLGSGFFIGLGLGFVGSGLFPLVRRSAVGECRQQGEANVPAILIGAFLILTGISFVWVPAAAIWPYAIAGILILAGIWLLVRGFNQR